MTITIPYEMLSDDITTIPNVEEKTIEYLRKKGCNTIEDVIDNESKLAKKHFNHFKVKLFWVVLDIKDVKG